MDDAGSMGSGNGAGHLTRVLDEVLLRNRLLDRLPQSSAFDQLHDNVHAEVAFAAVVNSDDIRVIQGRNRASFACESFDRVGNTFQMGWKEFDGNLPFEHFIAS